MPDEAELLAGRADRVWAGSQATVAARIYGPHFASLARQWCLRHADMATIGGVARPARPTEIACAEHGETHALDAVVIEDQVATGRVAAIGEANSTNISMDARPLRRLEHPRDLLPSDRVGSAPKLLLFSRTGFSPDLAEESAARPDVDLISLERIYRRPPGQLLDVDRTGAGAVNLPTALNPPSRA